MHITMPLRTTAQPGTGDHPHAGCCVAERTYQPAQLGTGGIATVRWWTHVGDGAYRLDYGAFPVVDGVLWLGPARMRRDRLTAPGDVPVCVVECLATWLSTVTLEGAL